MGTEGHGDAVTHGGTWLCQDAGDLQGCKGISGDGHTQGCGNTRTWGTQGHTLGHEDMKMQGPVSPECPHTCPHVLALTLFRSWMSGEKPVSMETSMMDMVASTLSRYLQGTGMRPPPCPQYAQFPHSPPPPTPQCPHSQGSLWDKEGLSPVCPQCPHPSVPILIPGVPVPSSPIPLPVSDVPTVPNISDVPNVSDVSIVSHLVQMVILTERMMPSGSLPVRGHEDTAATLGEHGRKPGGAQGSMRDWGEGGGEGSQGDLEGTWGSGGTGVCGEG